MRWLPELWRRWWMAARRRGEWQKSDNYVHGCVWEYIAGDVLDHMAGSAVLMELHFRM